MKVVIDTNVFVSGIFWRGAPRNVLVAWQRGLFQWVVSTPILDEYQRVLSIIGKRHPTVPFQEILDLVAIHAEAVSSLEFVPPICKDADDDKFLGAAITSGAKLIVTGDKLLLDVDGFSGIKILPPNIFLEVIRFSR